MKRSMLRWTVRILIVFVVLILVAGVVIHFVLQSAWLGDLILARAGDAIGMNVTAESLSVGWGGETSIRNAAVTMPLTGEVVLVADRIEVAHEVIPLLILGRPVNVQSVEVDHPEVNLRHYEGGRWNVQDVWTRVRARKKPVDRRRRRVSLPEVVIQDARVHIAEPNGTAQTVGPLNFRAQPKDRLLWQFDLHVPETVEVQGGIVPGPEWAHEVGFAVADIEPLIHRLAGGNLTPIRAKGRWEGKVLQETLSGTIRLDEFAIGSVTARGVVLVQAKSGEVTVSPRDLVLSEPNLAGREVRLTGGSVRIAGRQVHIERLAATSSVLTAQVNGSWDVSARTGEFSGSWAGTADRQFAEYSGTYHAAVKAPQFGRKAARLSISARAETSFGEMIVVAGAEGGGPDWRQSQWQVSVPTFVWSRDGKQVDLSGAAAELRLAGPGVRLTSLSLPGAETASASARFDPNTRRWSARLAVEDLKQLTPWGIDSLNLRVNVEGDDRKAYISELRVAQGERIVVAKGELSFREWGFQEVRLAADWPAGEGDPNKPQAHQPIGRWHLDGDIFGRIQPLAIEMTGKMTGQNILFGKHRVSRVEVPVRAKADAQAVQMTTDPVEMFGGQWQVSGRHDLSTNLTQIAATAEALSLEAVAAMAGVPLASRGQAHAEIQVAVQDFDLASAVATGSWDAQDVNIPPLQAQKAHGKLRIAGGLARFDEILLEREGGRAQATVEFRLDDPQAAFVELTSHEWPARFEGTPVLLYVDGKARLQVNPIKRTADGEARLSGMILLREQEFSRVRVVATVQGQTVNIRELHAETLGGTLDGQAEIPLNRWKSSTAKLAWQGIQPRRLQPWVPQFERFEGVVSGSLEIERVEAAARPPEPMRFLLDADIENGRFGPAPVDSFRIAGFFGDTRLLIDEASLQAVEGQVKTRARANTHGGRYYGSVAADFNDLNLDQIVHVVEPNAAPHLGYLSGTVTALGSSEWNSFGGEARINLTRSDLGNNSIIAALYNTLSLKFGQQEPTGTGELTIRLEGAAVRIPSFSYFNRGVEIRGAGEIDNINRGAESPVIGFAVGSTRVLKGINLPGVDSLDRLLATFQSGAASVRIGGTLAKTEVNVVPLPIVLGSFRNLLWAQLRQ